MANVESDEPIETLNDALIRTGDQEYIRLLSEQALEMTKQEICDFLNRKSNPPLSEETEKSLFKFGKKRVMEGKRVFPWDTMDEDDYNQEDNMDGGFW